MAYPPQQSLQLVMQSSLATMYGDSKGLADDRFPQPRRKLLMIKRIRLLPRNRSFLLYSSDRTGKPQAFRMNLRTGESELLTEADSLDGFC